MASQLDKIYVVVEKYSNDGAIYMIFWGNGKWLCHGLDGEKWVETKTAIDPENWPDGWSIGNNYSTVPSLHCAECGALSWYDYLCPACRDA